MADHTPERLPDAILSVGTSADPGAFASFLSGLDAIRRQALADDLHDAANRLLILADTLADEPGDAAAWLSMGLASQAAEMDRYAEALTEGMLAE